MFLSIIAWALLVYVLAAVGERLNTYILQHELLLQTSQIISSFTSRGSITGIIGLATEKDVWQQLDSLKNKMLWHQLTLKLLDIVKNPDFKGEKNATRLYSTYIKECHMKMNPVLLAEVMSALVSWYNQSEDKMRLLQEVQNVTSNEEAASLYKILRADLLFTCGDINSVKVLLDEVEDSLGSIPVKSGLHGRFYKLMSQWHESRNNYVCTYKNLLRYLGCVDVSRLTEDELIQVSKKLVTAAIVGEGLYNLGEVLCHPVMECLHRSPEHAWLGELLGYVEQGRVAQVLEMEEKSKTSQALDRNWELIKEKTRLLCIVQMCFLRISSSRDITLREISQKTGVSEDAVEKLLMRAMAQGLITGSIDQVEGTVSITWVQPRTLKKEQLIPLIERLDDWCSNIKTMETTIIDRVEELQTYS